MNKFTAIALLALFCVASATVVHKSPKEVFMTETLAKMGGLLCDMCEDIVKDGDSAGVQYSDHWLQDKIEDMLTDVVGDLDSLIKQKLAPEVCCKKVELCD
ncbi:hypothetical protein QR680_016014 [Steinernema hermaphroditum]|uniref:Saposin B-type domain-containing protein n=1 Tax=Steinernema hermaphroditum TaxID=289476 RepID=A0AA39HAS8_9BILA|nr:hypothetical protein QR680_016014 [Steinernema hermaphroditum]